MFIIPQLSRLCRQYTHNLNNVSEFSMFPSSKRHRTKICPETLHAASFRPPQMQYFIFYELINA